MCSESRRGMPGNQPSETEDWPVLIGEAWAQTWKMEHVPSGRLRR